MTSPISSVPPSTSTLPAASSTRSLLVRDVNCKIRYSLYIFCTSTLHKWTLYYSIFSRFIILTNFFNWFCFIIRDQTQTAEMSSWTAMCLLPTLTFVQCRLPLSFYVHQPVVCAAVPLDLPITWQALKRQSTTPTSTLVIQQIQLSRWRPRLKQRWRPQGVRTLLIPPHPLRNQLHQAV